MKFQSLVATFLFLDGLFSSLPTTTITSSSSSSSWWLKNYPSSFGISFAEATQEMNADIERGEREDEDKDNSVKKNYLRINNNNNIILTNKNEYDVIAAAVGNVAVTETTTTTTIATTATTTTTTSANGDDNVDNNNNNNSNKNKESKTTKTTVTETSQPFDDVKVPKREEEEGYHYNYYYYTEDEEQQQRSLIINGYNANPSDYPYFARYLSFQVFPPVANPPLLSVCGGTLIAPDIILTAASCYNPSITEPVAVRIGSYVEQMYWEGFYIENNGSETIPVDLFILHPDYSEDYSEEPGLDYDVMILKLESSSTKPYIRLNDNPNVLKDAVMEDGLHTVGFGETLTIAVNSTPTVLQDVDVSYIPNEDCVVSGGQGFLYDDDQIPEDVICAADVAAGQDSCPVGDSGGPLIIKGLPGPHDDIQVGITSFGGGDQDDSCGDPDFPGVYTRVSFHYQWIRKQVCRLSEDPPSYMDCNSFPILELFDDRLQVCGFGEDKSTNPTSYVESISLCVKHNGHFHNKCVSVADLQGLSIGQEYKSDHFIVDVGCCDEDDILENGGGSLRDSDSEYCSYETPICEPNSPGWKVDDTSRSGAVQTIVVCIDGTTDTSIDPFGEVPPGASSVDCGSCGSVARRNI